MDVLTPYADRLRAADHDVRTVPLGLVQAIVAEHHYARGGSNTATFRHGLFHRDRPWECLGVAWWIPPTKTAARFAWPNDWRRVLTLSRLVIVPGVPKNAAVFLLSRSVQLIVRRGDGWRCLVTFADTWRGHTGFIYRVAGWEACGLTDPEEVWIDPRDGRMVSRKAGPKTRTRAQMLALGYRPEGKHPKHRFRKVLPEPRPQRNLFAGFGHDR